MSAKRIVLAILGMALAVSVRADVMLVTGNDYPPFTDQDLPDGGLSTRLVQAAFAATGAMVEIHFQPWLRGYRATLNGDFAATFPYVHTDQRESEMVFSDPFMNVDTVIISRATQPLDYASVASLQGMALCRAQGWGLPAAIRDGIDAGIIEVVDAPQYTSCFRMLLAGRVDFLLSNNLQWEVQAQVNHLNPDDFHLATTPVQRSHHYLIAAKTPAGKAIIEQFNTGLARLKNNGDFGRIVRGYPTLWPEEAED
ncbi:ABC transporter substrate-binding protein [Saccharospirillum sp. MSK14-1]|uniref:substrate-binding periplasmic protein n=1 Tax=Saccharospirillum sp. MSK14-1 TaxID=1897632 RepID=UPI001304CC89|nr:transporter substrate-binding domain-containing protein [Saccharospirillum sp. MSK14-1]